MKTLFLIRHAKSSWDEPSADDFDRPLNERGKKDAPAMAKRMIRNKLGIDLFVSSPARRAKATARLFAEAFSHEEKDICYHQELYQADSSTFSSVISRLDDKYQSVAIFSHNPGITDFVNSITEVRVDNMPTCSVFGVRSAARTWKEFISHQKEFLFFDFPKSDAHHR
jgi:phosphohistidine phosphatase